MSYREVAQDSNDDYQDPTCAGAGPDPNVTLEKLRVSIYEAIHDRVGVRDYIARQPTAKHWDIGDPCGCIFHDYLIALLGDDAGPIEIYPTQVEILDDAGATVAVVEADYDSFFVYAQEEWDERGLGGEPGENWIDRDAALGIVDRLIAS